MRVEIWIWNFIYSRSVQNSSSLEFDEFSSRFTENLFVFDDYFSHCSQISSWQTLQNTFDVFVLFIFFLTNKEHIKNSSFLIFFF